MKVFNPSVGTYIHNIYEEAIKSAVEQRDSISFNFNGVEMVATPESDVVTLTNYYFKISEQNAADWRASPAGKQAAIEARERLNRCQKNTDLLILTLPETVRDLEDMVRWCVALSESADHTDVKWNPGSIADTIEEAGYEQNAHVGKPPEMFSDKRLMGEWLVGQAIDCLRKGLPPHQVIHKFAKNGGFI